MLTKHIAYWLTVTVLASPLFAQAVPSVDLQLSLKKLEAQAQKISQVAGNQEKAKGWLLLNQLVVKFAAEMNRAFPHTTIQGDKIDPPQAQKLAEKATSYGVK